MVMQMNLADFVSMWEGSLPVGIAPDLAHLKVRRWCYIVLVFIAAYRALRLL